MSETEGWHEIGETMYPGPRREHPPCPTTVMGVLGFPEPTVIPCGLGDGHYGRHRYVIEWGDAWHRHGDGSVHRDGTCTWIDGEPCDPPSPAPAGDSGGERG